MSNRLEVAGIDHLVELAPRLRAADIAEIHAATASDPIDVLVISLALSSMAWVWLFEERVVAVGGVAPHPYSPDVGVPWAFGSDEVHDHRDFFLDGTAFLFEKMHLLYPILENHVDARNHAAVKFLRMSGFTIEPPEPYGVFGLPFHRFHKERPQCASPSPSA